MSPKNGKDLKLNSSFWYYVNKLKSKNKMYIN